jgi:hypothetical protein
MTYTNPPIIEGPGPTDGDVPTFDAASGTWQAEAPGGGSTTVPLVYADTGPFDVPVWGLPAGYVAGEGIATLGAQLTIGSTIGSGILQDALSNPIPDGWTFPATIFVESNVIYDIISISPWQDETQGGIVVWGDFGGPPTLLYVPGGLNVFGPVIFSNLPPSDPANPGQLWNHDGVLTVSAG